MATDGTTLINSVGLCFTLFMGLLILLLPRRYALVPLIILTCYMTMGQRVIIATLDFTMLRIVILFGWVRIAVRGEFRGIRFNVVDKLLLLWVLVSMITYTLLWQTPEAFINRLGLAYNAAGLYFLFRFLLRDFEDVERAVRIFALVLVPVAGSMLIEKTTGVNSFAFFGGVSELTMVRDGFLRCQGPFGHPILAGTFGATLFPLFVGLWMQGRPNRLRGAVGILSSTIIVITSASSTPFVTYFAAIVALCFWLFRNHMRSVRWGLLFMFIALNLAMKAPVWFIITRVKVFSGSTAYHRAILIDQAIANLGDWWLLGTKSTAHWGYHLTDITNQFIRVGVDGGLPALFLFVWLVVFCFATLGRAMREPEGSSRREQLLLWSMGSALFTHVTAFFGVSYWDQIIVVWYLLLAMIATAGSLFRLEARDPAKSDRPGESQEIYLSPPSGDSREFAADLPPFAGPRHVSKLS